MFFRLKPWVALWTQPRFDIRLNAGAGTDVVVERPGLWWDDADLERLQDDLMHTCR